MSYLPASRTSRVEATQGILGVMVVERYTHERAVQIEAQMIARGMAPVQGLQRRLDILAAAGLPRVRGPRPLENGDVEMNVYTWAEAADILRHHNLCWHEREALLKYGSGRAAPLTVDERRRYWASVLTALALGLPGCDKNGCYR